MQNMSGVLSAREFVWWYNGHPEYADLNMDLSSIKSVAICGLGNVAIDCARILLQPAERLASTDIAEHALRQLRNSSVQQVHLIGRRGPVQVILYMLIHCQCTAMCITFISQGMLFHVLSFLANCWVVHVHVHVHVYMQASAAVPSCLLFLLSRIALVC